MTKAASPLLSRSFHWLNATQFLGALNDNVFRWLVFFFLVARIGETQKEAIIASVTTVFVLPFLLFSHAAGVLADRLSKRTIVVAAKVLEIAVMALGCAALLQGSRGFLYGVVFAMSAQSALFGPAKYGIIPELVAPERLSQANGRLVGATYLAIIMGTFLTPFLLQKVFPGGFLAIGVLTVALAVAGTLTSLGIERTPSAGSKKRFTLLFPLEIWRTLREIGRDRYLLMTVLGSAYFLYLGGFVQQNALLFGQDVLGLDWYRSGYLFPVAAVGIGVGSLLAGRLSGRNIEFGIVPVGAAGLAVACALLGIGSPSLGFTRAMVFLIGVSSGLFVVPLDAFMQHRSPPAIRGEIMACASFLGFVGVILSAGTVQLLSGALGMNPAESFLVVAGLTALLLIATVIVLPDFLVRFAIVLVTRLIYRVRTVGEGHMPTEGGALLVPNHASWVDALLLSVTTQRRIRFVMDRDIAQWRLLRPLFRLLRTIPISSHDSPRHIVQSLQEARQALDDGYLVCIFAEGTITRNGNLGEFHAGFERILRGSNYPVIPVYIGGAWGSLFSYYHGRILSSLPRRIPYPVTILFGRAMPSQSSAWQVRQAVSLLSGEWFDSRRGPRRTLLHAFLRVARRNWSRPAVLELSGRRLNYLGLVTAATALGEPLRRLAANQAMVGVLLPPSVAGAVANLAVTLMGKAPVNLNFTASAASFDSAVKQCELRTVVSSRVFLQKLPDLKVPEGTVFMEDLVAGIGRGQRLRAVLKAVFAPVSAFVDGRLPGPDDVATVIFSSGSTAEPKGVMLSHHNLLSNVDSATILFRFRPGERMCSCLPLFHSFGLTATLWLPLLNGIAAAFHPNPLDAAGVGRMVREHRLTFLPSTPTFLMAYAHRVERAAFASLRAVYAGGEKLTPRVAEAFEQAFGLRPLEGYGTTELSPVAAFNIPDVADGAERWSGAREGSIGRPVPGVTMKTVDPETSRERVPGEEGLLLVSGPNVMIGYLKRLDLTSEVLREGWYQTGDIARVEPDGFVFLVDRLSRFSKIGGEMIPHAAVEDVLLAGVNSALQPVVVTGAPDGRKGEQIVVLYTDEAGSADTLRQRVRDSALPNLWRPKERNYYRVDGLPLLGTGKLDLRRVRQAALQQVGDGEGEGR